MSTLVFRFVHYLPIVHAALAICAGSAAAWVVGTTLSEKLSPGLSDWWLAVTVCRVLAIGYLALAAVHQWRLSRSGHDVIAQPGRLWMLLIAEQSILLMLLVFVWWRGPTSRVQMAGLHQSVAGLFMVTALTMAGGIIDRLVAIRLIRSIPDYDPQSVTARPLRFEITLIVAGAALCCALGYLETQALPYSATGTQLTSLHEARYVRSEKNATLGFEFGGQVGLAQCGAQIPLDRA